MPASDWLYIVHVTQILVSDWLVLCIDNDVMVLYSQQGYFLYYYRASSKVRLFISHGFIRIELIGAFTL